MLERARNIVLSGAIATSPVTFDDQPAFTPETFEPNATMPTKTAETEQLNPEQKQFREVRETIDSFSWEDFNDDEKLSDFISVLTQAYFDSTDDTYFSQEYLEKNTYFFRNYDELQNKAEEISPDFPLSNNYVEILLKEGNEEDFGVRYLLNLEAIKDSVDPTFENPGYFIADRLFKAWIYEDVGYNDFEGDLIGNENFKLTELGYEKVDGYYGGMMISENDNFTLLNFHDHLAHAISSRLLVEKIGLDLYDYEKYGAVIASLMPKEAELLAIVTSRQEVDIDDLKAFYIDSRTEEIFRILGEYMIYVPDQNDELNRYDFEQYMFNGFLYAQIIDRGFEYPNDPFENDNALPIQDNPAMA